MASNERALHYASDAVQEMFENDYFDNLKTMHTRLEDFKNTLLLCQNDGKRANLGDVFERISILEEKYKERNDILQIIRTQWDRISSDFHALCMMLDWRKCGSKYLTEDDRNDGLNGLKFYLKHVCGDDEEEKLFKLFEKVLIEYEAGTGIFEGKRLKNLNSDSDLLDVLTTYRALRNCHKDDIYGLFFMVAEDICSKRKCIKKQRKK